MAYDEDLAQRVRAALEHVADVREQRMLAASPSSSAGIWRAA